MVTGYIACGNQEFSLFPRVHACVAPAAMFSRAGVDVACESASHLLAWLAAGTPRRTVADHSVLFAGLRYG